MEKSQGFSPGSRQWPARFAILTLSNFTLPNQKTSDRELNCWSLSSNVRYRRIIAISLSFHGAVEFRKPPLVVGGNILSVLFFQACKVLVWNAALSTLP